MASIKRNSSITLGSPQIKCARLDPMAHQSDTTVGRYHVRVAKMLPDDRSKIHIKIDISHFLDGVKATIADLYSKHEILEKNNADLADRLVSVEDDYAWVARGRITMHVANLLTILMDQVAAQMGRKIGKEVASENLKQGPPHAKNKYTLFARRVTKAQLAAVGVDESYLPDLARYGALNAQRNTECHRSEHEFARILTSKRYADSHEYHHWGKLFRILFGKTPEEMVAEEDGRV